MKETMSDSEFDEFLVELRQIIFKYNFNLSETRKARDISIISSPTTEN